MEIKMRKFLVTIITLALLVGTIPAFAQDSDMQPTIADIVIASAQAEEAEFTTLLAAVLAADEAVVTALSNPEAELTVFAPTDAAFAALVEALGEDAFNEILADTETLTNILLYHVVAGKVMAEDVVGLDGSTVETLLTDYFVNVSVDEDGNVFINNAQVVMVDIEAANGVIHVIDAVLVPSEETMYGTIADIVIAAAGADEAEFTVLLTAVLAADEAVVTALSDPEAELTVFAPTDAAFAALIEALGAEAFNGIVADTEALTSILLYHVVAGEVFAADVVGLDGVMVDTLLEGDPIAISVTDEGVFVDGAQVVVTDIKASNGVIHVIDAVIVPNGE
jgi:uncharacterized surface protein with fasciclin (FAS1) repeats